MLLTRKKILFTGVSPADTINTRETITSVEFKKQKVKELKEKWREKPMDGQFIRKTTQKVDKEENVAMVIKRSFKGWNRSIVVLHTGADSQDKLYEVPHR